MSAHTPGVLVAFTEPVKETIRGFEVCTVSETDRNHHPKLLAIATKYADARLYAAAPDLLAACEAARRIVSARVEYAKANSFKTMEATLSAVLADLDAAIAKARGGT